jgi:hypothetical protein
MMRVGKGGGYVEFARMAVVSIRVDDGYLGIAPCSGSSRGAKTVQLLKGEAF